VEIRRPEAVPAFLDYAVKARGQTDHELRPLAASQERRHCFPGVRIRAQIEFLGQPARLVLALDMTEQERALTALRTSEARFRALSESAPIGVFEFDAAGRCIYHNPALSELSGALSKNNLGYG